MKPEEKLCCLLFDETGSKEELQYNPGEDSTLEMEEFGFIGGPSEPANTASVFMMNGTAFSWKQLLCYFLSREGVSAENLTMTVKEVLSTLVLFIKVYRKTEERPYWEHMMMK